MQHSSQSHHSLPSKRHGDFQKKFCFLEYNQRAHQQNVKEPNMPKRAQAKEVGLILHQPQAEAPHKKASTQMTRESGEIQNPYLPGSIPIHLDWGLPPR